MAKVIRENNYFEFEDKVYRQKLGTAIGTKFVPAFSNIFMANLESRMLQECHVKPWKWWRFLDHIFLIWFYREEKLKEFLKYVNDYHHTIKYTWA